MGWLLGSMRPNISDYYLFLETAHQIWDSLAKAYSQVGHTVKVFDLRQRIAQFKQRDKPLAIYYSALRKMWEELTHYATFHPSYSQDASTCQKHVEEIQAFEFLARLNPDYE